MIRQQINRTVTIAGAVLIVLLQLGCKTAEEPSEFVGDYTFSRDFDGERRVLRIDPSADQVAECMQASLPTGESTPWKATMLSAPQQRALLDLLLDQDRFPVYQTDTKTAAQAEVLICQNRVDDSDFCYVPQVVVTGLSSPWRFALQPEVALSNEGQELIDEFLGAHEACWDGGTPMDGDR